MTESLISGRMDVKNSIFIIMFQILTRLTVCAFLMSRNIAHV